MSKSEPGPKEDVLDQLRELLNSRRSGVADSDTNVMDIECPVPYGLLYRLQSEIEGLREIIGPVSADWGPVLIRKRRELECAVAAISDFVTLTAILRSGSSGKPK
jgi:hypothetical protein